ncbi:MAG: AraC family transcriptional regulator [Leptothrix sp. (in: b-proteobacteria)]
MSRPVQPPERAILRWQVSACEQIEFVQARMGPCGLAGHFHDVWSIGLILRGACRFSAGGVEYHAPTGSVFILPPYELHACGAASVDVAYAVLYVEAAVMQQQAPRLAALVHETAQRVWQAHAGVQPLFDEAAHLAQMSAACRWLIALERALVSTPPQTAIRSSLTETLHPLQRLFHTRWAETIGLAEAELSLVGSRWHTIRTFRRTTGLAPGAYLRQLRVQKSRRWLTEGHSLADIALQLGFADQAHFTRTFKAVYGVPPNQLKKLLTRAPNDGLTVSDPERRD